MPRNGNVCNSDDVIDSRDVIARIDELTDEIDGAEISEDNGAEPQLDDNGKTIEDIATCGECGKSWNDALISDKTPVPSGRCPYEDLHDEIAELKTLRDLQEQCEGYAGDWKYGATLVRDDYFTTYAQDYAEEIGAIKDCSWPNNCIDWEQAASELQQDYTSVEFDGVTYWVR